MRKGKIKGDIVSVSIDRDYDFIFKGSGLQWVYESSREWVSQNFT